MRYALRVHVGHVSSCVAMLLTYSSCNTADTSQAHSKPKQICVPLCEEKWEMVRL